jgi:hypothetical protein
LSDGLDCVVRQGQFPRARAVTFHVGIAAAALPQEHAAAEVDGDVCIGQFSIAVCSEMSDTPRRQQHRFPADKGDLPLEPEGI